MSKTYNRRVEELVKLVYEIGQYGNCERWTDDVESIICEVEKTGSIGVVRDTYDVLGYWQRDSYYIKSKPRARNKPWADEIW